MPTGPRLNPPFRADHVGSLLRPRALKQAFRDFGAGDAAAGAFREILDQCVRGAVALQESVGLESITDGEFRRGSYWSHFVDAIEGMAIKESLFQFRDADGVLMNFTAPHVAGRVHRKYGIGTDAFAFLKSVTRRTPKVTMPSPSTMHFWRGRAGIEPAAYSDAEEFFADLARIYREEVADLATAGATYLQIDEVPLAMLCDPNVRESVAARGEDPERLTTCYIEAINSALDERPQNVAATMHLCRGNYKGRWVSEGGYDTVAERLFNEAKVDAFFLEYDTPRSGDFAPLRFVPRDRLVVLGLVSTKSPALESKDALRRRIDEAARFVALDQLALSPQCGFASTVAGNPLSEDDERRKLALVVEVARAVWG
ncbi:MAG TPA: 5-methyltetrahydropteroyltriglutamate--homocysteine S-methyltransferase [Candidatus Binataceae bacterium]